MLAKQNRANPAEVLLAREKGKLIPGFLFGLLVFNLEDQRPSRFAFIVSTKIDKRAVRRNQIRRNLKAALKEDLPIIKNGWLVLFLAKKKLLNQDLEIIKKEVKRIIRKAGLI